MTDFTSQFAPRADGLLPNLADMTADIAATMAIFKDNLDAARGVLILKLSEAGLQAYNERESLDAEDHQAIVILEGVADDLFAAIRSLERIDLRTTSKLVRRAVHFAHDTAEPEAPAAVA